MTTLARPATSSGNAAPGALPHTVVRLDDLLAPISVEDFLEGYWDRRHLLVERRDSTYFRPLLCFADVDRLLELSRSRQDAALSRIGHVEERSQEKRGRVDAVPLQTLYRAFHSGETIKLYGMETSWPPLLPLLGDLRRQFAAEVDANLYLTPAHSNVTPAHVDHEEVFVLQAGGSKVWTLFEADPARPLERLEWCRSQGGHTGNRRDEKHLRPLAEIELRAGDFLYVPRGIPHRPATSGEPSLHITLGIHPFTELDRLRAALELAAGADPELRRALGGIELEAELEIEVEAALRRRLHAVIDALDLRHAHRLVRKRALVRDLPCDGHFASLATLGQLALETVVERRPGLTGNVTVDERTAVLHFENHEVRVPRRAVAALELVCHREHLAVSELPDDLGDSGKLVLARRLVRDGFLRIRGATVPAIQHSAADRLR